MNIFITIRLRTIPDTDCHCPPELTCQCYRKGQSESEQKTETNSCRLFADKIQDKTIYNFYQTLPYKFQNKNRLNNNNQVDVSFHINQHVNFWWKLVRCLILQNFLLQNPACLLSHCGSKDNFHRSFLIVYKYTQKCVKIFLSRSSI